MLDEDDETVEVSLTSPQNATIATGESTETGTITDDDDTPNLSQLLMVLEVRGQNQMATISFAVTLSPVSGRDVTVIAKTSSGSIG